MRHIVPATLAIAWLLGCGDDSGAGDTAAKEEHLPPPRNDAAPAAIEVDTPEVESSVRRGINDRFLAADLDVDQFINIFEGESREIFRASAVDLAFVCDTYHHFEYPKSSLASLHKAIRPGGALVVIDFKRVAGESSDWVLDHVRAGQGVFRAEIEAAGFEFVQETEVEGLAENYVLRFRRP